MKKWEILTKEKDKNEKVKDILAALLANRGVTEKADIETFLHPPNPDDLTVADVGIDAASLIKALTRIDQAIKNKESIVVYADYDADGITAGAIMWETLHGLGAQVMPYIPHRVEEGYGLSQKGIDAVKEKYNPTLIVTVDHGISAKEKVEYAKHLGIEIIVTDHHTKPAELPDCLIVHTTTLCGAGVSWFVSKELLRAHDLRSATNDLLSLACIGTIADLMPLIGPNRSIVKYGLAQINKTKRVGLKALIEDAGLVLGDIQAYGVSHAIAPRLNAMGRIVHAMDALRLLCTKQEDKALLLAQQLGLTNKDRQQLTMDMSAHAKMIIEERIKNNELKKILFVVHESYNQGVIGLVAGKLVEEYYRPAIVLARGEVVSKASARSVSGFNIVEAIRAQSDLLVDVGGHPMAAGFTVETAKLEALQKRMEELAEKEITEDLLTRTLRIDIEISLNMATQQLWQGMQEFAPFGFGNPEPVFTTHGVHLQDVRLIGKDNKHLKLRIVGDNAAISLDAVGFNMGSMYGQLKENKTIDIAYTIDMNEWNGNRKLQLKLKDLRSTDE